MEPASEFKKSKQKFASLSPKRKDLTHLLNINAKFAGTGGSNSFFSNSKFNFPNKKKMFLP